ncbi:MAG: glycosyltransferase family 2 protein [Ferruginibacter sp.]
MKKPVMDLSIIIVNYKSAQLVLDCIESINKETASISFEIIVVDNGSNDNSKEIITGKYPAVIWIDMGYNSGFARANNAGMEISRGNYILLLNSDTIILDRAIEKSLALLQRHPEAAGCGVQLLNTDGSTQISGAHVIKGGLNTLLQLPYLGALIRYLGYRFKSTIPSVQTITETIEVDWVVGAFIMIKKEVLTKSGLFDNDFFMYSEEMEWCGRLRKHGKLLLFAEPKVIHIQGGTSSNFYDNSDSANGKNLWDSKGRQIIVSNMLRIRKQFGIGWFLFNVGFHVLEIPVFFICLLFDMIFTSGDAKYTWNNLVNYIKNITNMLRYFIKILFNVAYFYKVN